MAGTRNQFLIMEPKKTAYPGMVPLPWVRGCVTELLYQDSGYVRCFAGYVFHMV